MASIPERAPVGWCVELAEHTPHALSLSYDPRSHFYRHHNGTTCLTGTRSALLVPGEPTSITVHRLTGAVPIWAADGTAGTRAIVTTANPVTADKAQVIFFISAASIGGQRSNRFYSLHPRREKRATHRHPSRGGNRPGRQRRNITDASPRASTRSVDQHQLTSTGFPW